MDIQELKELIALGDPPFIERYYAMNKEGIELILETFGKTTEEKTWAKPPPKWEDIQTIELSIFDNWKYKKWGNRWGIVLSVWTNDVCDLTSPDWKASSILWGNDVFKKEIKAAQRKQLKYPLSDASVNSLTVMNDHLGKGFNGILRHKAKKQGTFSHDGCYVHLNLDENKAILIMPGITEQIRIDLKDFDKMDAKGKPLKKKCVAQKRWSKSPKMKVWGTTHSKW